MDADVSRRLRLLVAFISLLFLSGAATGSDAYLLGPGDEIKIQVYQEDDLSMELELDESGVFNYPYLGSIKAAGRTLAEVEQVLTQGLLQDILINPSVNVSITSYRNFYIGGEVKSPGGYPYHPGLTVQQAITIAGGPTEWASRTKFTVLREGQALPTDAEAQTPVRPGDTVTVLEGLF